jgi:FtsH-binding integral membrane protein
LGLVQVALQSQQGSHQFQQKPCKNLVCDTSVKMESFTSYFEGRNANVNNFDALKNFNALSSGVQKHLQKVYLTLTASILVAAIGVYAHTLLNLGGTLTHLGFLGLTIWLTMTPSSPAEEGKRLSLLMGAAFFQGCSLGQLVQAILEINPSIVLTAFLGTSTVFACFTAASLLAQRRSYLYLGGMLSSAVSVMLMLHLGSWVFGGSVAVFQVGISKVVPLALCSLRNPPCPTNLVGSRCDETL